MKIKFIFFRALSYLTIFGAVGFIVWAVMDIKPYISQNTKIETLAASTGLSKSQVTDMADGCVRTIEPSCLRAPVSTGRYYVIMDKGNTIGGKWGGSRVFMNTSLTRVSAVPNKIKNWKSSITNQPFKNVNYSVKLILEDAVRSLHQDHETYLSMDVVTPYLSGAGTFDEKNKTYERNLSLFTVTVEEMKLFSTIHIDGWMVVSMLFIDCLILLWAAIFYAFSVDQPPAKKF